MSYPADITFNTVGHIPGGYLDVGPNTIQVFKTPQKWEDLFTRIRENDPLHKGVQTPKVDLSTRNVFVITVSTSSSADKYRVTGVQRKEGETLQICLGRLSVDGVCGLAVMGRLTLVISVLKTHSFKTLDASIRKAAGFCYDTPELNRIAQRIEATKSNRKKLEKDVKELYGTVLYDRFSSLTSIKEIDILPQIDNRIHVLFKQIFRIKDHIRDLQREHLKEMITFSKSLKGPNLLRIDEQSPLKKHKA